MGQKNMRSCCSKWSFGAFAVGSIEGCPWDEYTCVWAARCGHLELLQWARSEGCPWDERTCEAAAEGGHWELVPTPLEARAMTCEVCVRGGVTFQARGHPFGVSDALAKLAFYPRDSFLQRVLSLEVTGSPEPSAVTGASEEPIVFPENYLEIEWQNPGVFSSFNLAAVVETTNDIVPVHGKVDFPIKGPRPEAYLSEGKIADQSRDIQQLAQELTADMDDLYLAVFALAQD